MRRRGYELLVSKLSMVRLWWRGYAVVHQADGDFEHVVAQGEVAEAVPSARGALTNTALGIAEVPLCIFVEARHGHLLRA
jgi:hypothetical protein